MRLLIITSCTGEKAHAPQAPLTLQGFQKGAARVKRRKQEMKQFTGFEVRAVNQESIHNHSAFAMVTSRRQAAVPQNSPGC